MTEATRHSEDKHFSLLLETVRASLQDHQFDRALRYIDRAARLAPTDPVLASLHGRLLAAAGDPAAAALLAKAAQARPDLQITALLIDALLAAGRLEDGRQQLASALQRFGVGLDNPLTGAARRCLAVWKTAFCGWVSIAPTLGLVGEVVTGPLTTSLEIIGQSPQFALRHEIAAGVGELARFCIPVPQSDRCQTLSAHVDGIPLIGTGLEFPPDFSLDGRASFADGNIAGWACLGWAPSLLAELLIADDHNRLVPMPLTTPVFDPTRRHFMIDPRAAGLTGNAFVISARLPNGSLQPLPDAPLLLEAPAPLTAARKTKRPAPLRSRRRRRISIIIPVYRDCEETLAGLEAVLATAGREAMIVVIDDASPEPELVDALTRLAIDGSITLLRNTHNLGFPATVNRGFGLHPENDVVILNADARVHGNWLARLRAVAYEATDIGTVTPLSNNGTIASYPTAGFPCSVAEAAIIDDLAARLDPTETVSLPTGVGFCMYIRRDCLIDIGPFDAATFGRGYGEENDFCMRAAQRGWRHMLAANVFIRHLGGRSFGRQQAALMERNRRLLNLRYPYDAIIEAFIAADPIHPVRRRLDEARLTAAGQEYVLIVTSGLAGGVARFVGERVRTLSADGATPLVLKPDAVRPDSCTLLLDGSELHDLYYQLPGDLATLRALFSRLQFRHIELHHFLGHDGALVDELLALGIDYDIYVHDNSWVCPRLTLLGGDGRYCGEPDLAGCTACIATYGSSLNEPLSTAELRQRSARWLGQARDIVVPSRDLASRLNRYFAGLAPQVTPWETDIEPQRLPSPLPQSPTRVAVIGAIGEQKGYRIVLACACDAAARSLPLEFVVIGYTQDDDALLNTGKAFVTGQYDEPEIDHLLRRERPRVAFFPSVAPESWCYTLSHALRAGLPIVAFDLGAIAERLRVAGLGKVVPVTTDAAQLNDLLLAEAADVASSGIKKGSTKLAQSDPSAPELPTTEQPSASVQAVTIAEGLYAFRVRAGAPARSAGPDGLLLPAINVGIAPGQPANIIEFMPGPRTEGNWLCEPGHALVARVSRQPATFLLTSLRVPDGPLLSIAIDRLDQPNHGAGDAQHLELPARPPTVDLSALQPPRPPGASKDIRTDGGLGGETQLPGLRAAIMAHIQRWGDTQFIDVSWAGYIGQHLWIEAFSINPLENITADQIEYKGLTAAGYETPWLSNRAPCGTRGMAMPLVGFAVRIKPSAGALAYDCEYSGAFVSGATIGPRRNGAPCFSTPDDPLEAIQLKILARAPSETAANGDAEPQQPDVSATLRPVEQSRRGRTLRSATTRANARVAAKQP